jgi:hypothetical protein
MASSTYPLSRSGRRPFARSQPLGTSTICLFSPSRCSEEGLSRQVSRWIKARLSQKQAKPWRCNWTSQESQDVPASPSITAPKRLGRVYQAGHGWTSTRASLPGPLYPSRGNQQSSAGCLRWRADHLSLERLGAREQATPHDTLSIGVLAALRATHSAARLCPHSPVWIPCQPAPFQERCFDPSLSCF